jgi:hypothetical protein
MDHVVLGRMMSGKFPSFDAFLALEEVERLRNRAEEMRMIAEEMISAENTAVALRLADSYERLAKLAEQRAHGTPREFEKGGEPPSAEPNKKP